MTFLCFQIDVLEDIGDIITSTGVVQLERGMRQLVKHEEVEMLLKQGKVKQVSIM